MERFTDQPAEQDVGESCPLPAFTLALSQEERRSRGEKGVLQTLAFVDTCFIVADLSTEQVTG